MHFRYCILAAVVAVVSAVDLPPPGSDGKYTLTAPGIRAKVYVHAMSQASTSKRVRRAWLTDYL